MQWPVMVSFFPIYSSMVKKVWLLYNEEAGHKEHEARELVLAVARAGYDCRAVSIKSNGWEKIPPEIDIVAVAGGDGTVSKVIKKMQKKYNGKKTWPVGILPFGTANNIANSIGTIGKLDELIAGWGQRVVEFNTATVKKGNKKHRFCEAAGFGLFPQHLRDMALTDSKDLPPPERLLAACKGFLYSVMHTVPSYYEIEADGYRQHGEYIMVELANTKWMGPSLTFAQDADHSDGLLELVLYTEADREALYSKIESMMHGKKVEMHAPALRASRFSIRSSATEFHVDEDAVENDPESTLQIEIEPGTVPLFIPVEK
jgi:diacylglycerol kinase (ATP)